MGPEVALIATVASGAISAFGALKSAGAQSAAADYQAQVARNNQVIAQQNAQYQTQVGAIKAQAQDFKTRAVLASQEAAQGASGIDLQSPSQRRVRESTAQIGRLDRETVYQDAKLQARADEIQASNFGATAGLKDMESASATSSGYMNAFSSLLGSAGSFADKWSSYQLKGVTPFGINLGNPIKGVG